ncbi:LacI family DNA-binding transcriptional regulator [Cellulomonas fengjieae]|uniref:LacI family DNA-binding transcriptional regulator n=1 Tax=Cellulomonas fengjieae TaxID=2819978 RepID=UPI001AB00A3F|nr:LacI family DNA-binding transcriptional regulator [Cellulomonas fengjieae]MBO3102862.1 LacI family DNA-binding transcriptional regulator [Cellulomonas fengjieae]
MATMRDVAAHAGVSPKTVSRVLRGEGYVRAEVRERVQASVRELAYVPNVLAVSFRAGRESAIGVAVPDIADPFFAQVIHAVEAVAKARHTGVIVTSLGNDAGDEQEAVENLLKRQIAGLIACPIGQDQSYLRPWQARTAMVFVDRAPGKLVADSVIEDDEGGGREATAYLVANGHRRIAFVGDAYRFRTTALRLQGYREALAEAGVGADDGLVYLGDTDGADFDAALREWQQLASPPTAIFSSNARCSLDVVPALQRVGWTDVALVSFGDFPMAGSLTPPVTVIDQDPAEVGRFAAERLFQRIDNPDRRLRRKTVLPVRLVDRSPAARATPA